MLYAKDGVTMNVNLAFEKLYLKQGWLPIVDEPINNDVVQATEEATGETIPIDKLPFVSEAPETVEIARKKEQPKKQPTAKKVAVKKPNGK